MNRRLWTGKSRTDLHATILDLARTVWRARLAAWLAAALPGMVIPVTFSSSSQSDLEWRLVGLIESGRLKDYAPDRQEETLLFWRQLEAVAYEVRPGPGKVLAWGVDDALLHDDLALSLALCGVSDDEDWRPRVARGRNE